MGDSLQNFEIFWQDHYFWLKERKPSYILRPRYNPAQTSDWKLRNYEHAFPSPSYHVLDAMNSKGEMVALKRINPKSRPFEGVIARYFSSNNRLGKRENHCVPVLDFIHVAPDSSQDDTPIIFVMPFLRPYDNPMFRTVGEALEFVRQAIEGICYMHLNKVAHRGISASTFMMDPKPLYPEGFHPVVITKTYDCKRKAKHCSRTAHPTKYYIVSLGNARRYSPKKGNSRETELPHHMTGKSAPELREIPFTSYDAFAADVYDLGIFFKDALLDKSPTFEFLRPFISNMTNPDPSLRPTMSQVYKDFVKNLHNLSKSKLQSRFLQRDDPESVIKMAYRGVRHLFWRLKYAGLNPLPVPITPEP